MWNRILCDKKIGVRLHNSCSKPEDKLEAAFLTKTMWSPLFPHDDVDAVLNFFQHSFLEHGTLVNSNSTREDSDRQFWAQKESKSIIMPIREKLRNAIQHKREVKGLGYLETSNEHETQRQETVSYRYVDFKLMAFSIRFSSLIKKLAVFL